MFTVETIHQDGFEICRLCDDFLRSSVQIIPSCGAILHGFSVTQQQGELNVIDHYQSKQDFETNLTTHGLKSCKLAPFACRIKDALYHFNGKEYRPEKYLLGKNAIHGLIYDKPFAVIAADADENSAEVVMQYAYKGEEKGYPFHFDCIIFYRLQQDNKLTISTTLVNKDSVAIPMQDGWHPYFTLGKKVDELELTLKTSKHVVFDAELIPTGEMVDYKTFYEGKKIGSNNFDDCFLLDEATDGPACILKDAEKGLQVEIWPDKTYPFLQVYIPPHRNSIALENLSAPPDAFNNQINLLILQPEEAKTFTTTYAVTVLK